MNRRLRAFQSLMAAFVLIIISQLPGQAQDCLFNCQDHVYVSFNSDCDYLLGPEDVMKNFGGCDTIIVTIYDHLGNDVPNPLTAQYRGKQLTYTAADTFGNSCWGYVTVEDKNPPMIDVMNDTITCWEEIPGVEPPPADCRYAPKVNFEDRFEKFLCDDDTAFVGIVHRTVWASDPWGNTRQDSYDIYIERITLDSVVCPGDTTIDCCLLKPDETSLPFGVTHALWNEKYIYKTEDGKSIPRVVIEDGQSVGLVDPPFFIQNGDTVYLNTNYQHCNVVSEYKDHIIDACGATYKIRREWLIKDWCADTSITCVQWFKIIDTSAPVLFYSEDFTPVQVLYTKPHECLAHLELGWPTIYNDCSLKFAKDNPDSVLQEFKVRYTMEYEDPSHPGKFVSSSGFIEYGETVTEYVPKTGLLFIKPYIQVRYYVSDPCWNEAEICQTILVYDQTPPTPVCDEITQTTLDPEECWVRIYAEDLTDGSHDNCDDSLYYGVATMRDIEYWRNYWQDSLKNCYEEYHYHRDIIDRIIEEWIDLYVFKEYVDATDCVTDSLVVRVYEGLNTPPYDPHVFEGSKLDWYNWHRAPLLRYNSYRCNYVFYYEQLVDGYPEPYYPNITCDDIQLGIFLEAIENGLIAILDGLNSFNFDELNMTVEDLLGVDVGIDELDDLLIALGTTFCESPFDPVNDALCIDLEEIFGDLNLSDIEISDASTQEVVDTILQNGFEMFSTFDLTAFGDLDLDGFILFGDEQEVLSAASITTSEITLFEILNIFYYFICYGDDLEMKTKVFENLATYPELLHFVTRPVNIVNLAYSGIIRKNFLDLPYYNDCMIVLYKDDKTPPVCIPPADQYLYCDGVKVSDEILLSNDIIRWTRADFAHFICDTPDVISATCEFDTDTDAPSIINTPFDFCFAAPWDGEDFGYYGGPVLNDYTYYTDEHCGDDVWSIHSGKFNDWRPMYCRVWLLLDQFDDPGGYGPDIYEYFGTPTFQDNCPNVEIDSITEGDLDECGVGYLTRTWFVNDGCGNETSCKQTIHVKPRSDFEVIFPEDVVIDCELEESLEIGEPIISDNECEQVGVSFEDQIFEVAGVGCYKIARKWKILNWCTFNADIHYRNRDVIVDDRIVASEDRYCVYRNLKDDGDGYMEYIQIIKVVDTIAPVLTCQDSIEACNYDPDCEPALVDVELGTATDNCTEDEAIEYTYIIKPEGSTSSAEYIYGHGNRIQNILPFGNHEVYLIASDGCGNTDTCIIALTVRDCKPPTPYCYDGIATVIMPSSGEITVWARDLDAGSFDNCTDTVDLRFTFSPIHPDEDTTFDAESNTSSMSFTCDELTNGQSELIQVTIYVWDEFDNVDFCTVGLLIQDGSGDICGDISASTESKKKIGAAINEFKNNQENSNTQFNNPRTNNNRDLINANDYVLGQNSPNPFNSQTIVRFKLPKSAKANLRILDLTGKVVFERSANYSAGIHEWRFDAKSHNLGSGVFYYQLETEEFVGTRKMIIVN